MTYSKILIVTSRTAIVEDIAEKIARECDIPPYVLKPRPQELCGIHNTTWSNLEKRGMSALARSKECVSCENAMTCCWQYQLTAVVLQGAQVIVMTSTYLELQPDLPQRIRKQGEKALLICDENSAAMTPAGKDISRVDMEKTRDAHSAAAQNADLKTAKKHQQIVDFLNLLLGATNDTLRAIDDLPYKLDRESMIEAQEVGFQDKSNIFKYVGQLAFAINQSHPESREVTENGIRFAIPPKTEGWDVVIYSATGSPEIASYRLNRNFKDIFAGVHINHSGSRFYNIADYRASKKNFPGNKRGIIFFFAALAAMRIKEGKRIAIVTNKDFIDEVIRLFNEFLQKLGVAANVGDLNAFQNNENINVVVFSYGAEGFNDLEHFECCYCVSSYYISIDVIDRPLQDLAASEYKVELEIKFRERPQKGRYATSKKTCDQKHPAAQLAPHAMRQEEDGTILQALGRSRPFTNGREVITMHDRPVAGIEYEKSFQTIDAARKHFGIPDLKSHKSQQSRRAVQESKNLGFTQAETVDLTDLSLSTVKRHWKGEP